VIDHLARLEDFYRISRRPRLSPEEVRRYQDRKLRRLVARAAAHVPYYQSLFERARVSAGDIRGVSDLPRIPPTSKKDLKRQAVEHYLDDRVDLRRLKVFRTTGSTGVPLLIYRSSAEDFLFHFLRLRTLRSYGLRGRDHVVRVRSGNLDYVPLSWRLVQGLGLFRQSVIDTVETPQRNAADLLALRPRVLAGYSGTLARLARIIRGDHDTTLPLKFVVGGADMLIPLFRKQIQDAFQCRIYDNYECQETGLLAWECPETGLYHVCDDNQVIEVLRDGRPAAEGESGEVIVTSLQLRTMPFIRYRLEDIVTLGPASCPCGRPFRTFRFIEAKKQDYFTLPGGREFYPWVISLLLIDLAPWIMQFQLVQERVDKVVMRAEVSGQPSPEELRLVREQVLPLLGPGVEFSVEIVPEIPATPGGKFWIRRSLVNSMYGDGPEA
jgi:phenylacetate-CoA ligase